MKANSFNPEKLKIRKIDVVSMELNNPEGLTAYDLEDFEIETEQEAEIGFNDEVKSSRVTITYNIFPIKENKRHEELSAKFKINFIISIDNYEELINEEDEGVIVDNHLCVNLVAVSISTGRGIIYSKLHSTHLENIILPIIDPKNLVKLPSK